MLKQIIRNLNKNRAETVVSRVNPFLTTATKLIDIGSGTGDVAILLKKQGKEVTPVDVANFHWYRNLQPIIYDGITLPFPDQTFDTALILMVMHHTPNPNKIFAEASRVANEIVVIETSYTNLIHKIYTVVTDLIGNLQIVGFWNSYKTDESWKSFFITHGFGIKECHKYWDLGILHISYHLTRKR
jgi:ubiquinone/menaquinone biosynthesis C-methylase UbiE